MAVQIPSPTASVKSTNSEFLTVASFCVIGVLVMLNVMLRFPEFGTLVAQYNQF
jgi:hypothetical protein